MLETPVPQVFPIRLLVPKVCPTKGGSKFQPCNRATYLTLQPQLCPKEPVILWRHQCRRRVHILPELLAAGSEFACVGKRVCAYERWTMICNRPRRSRFSSVLIAYWALQSLCVYDQEIER